MAVGSFLQWMAPLHIVSYHTKKDMKLCEEDTGGNMVEKIRGRKNMITFHDNTSMKVSKNKEN